MLWPRKEKGAKLEFVRVTKYQYDRYPRYSVPAEEQKHLYLFTPCTRISMWSMYSVPVQTTPVPSTQYVHLGCLNDCLVSPPHCTCAHAHPHLHPRLRFVFPFSLPPPSICIFLRSTLFFSLIFCYPLFTLSSVLLLVASLWFPRFRALLSSISSGDT